MQLKDIIQYTFQSLIVLAMIIFGIHLMSNQSNFDKELKRAIYTRDSINLVMQTQIDSIDTAKVTYVTNIFNTKQTIGSLQSSLNHPKIVKDTNITTVVDYLNKFSKEIY